MDMALTGSLSLGDLRSGVLPTFVAAGYVPANPFLRRSLGMAMRASGYVNHNSSDYSRPPPLSLASGPLTHRARAIPRRVCVQ